MIHIRQLTKTYGRVTALDDVTFSAVPGRVTGFLGLNGSGKTTTLRILLGLTRATSGAALINGQPYRDLDSPSRQVGAVLEQGISHPGQTGRDHLVTQALLSGAGRARVEELLSYVGLTAAARTRTAEYSLGMRQRLAMATALLGSPSVLVLDEPGNGLDPSGMAWLRGLLREHASNGGTVLLASHLLAELEQLVDDVVIIADGRVRLTAPLVEVAGGGVPRLRVRGRDPHRLWQAFERVGATVTTDGRHLYVSGLSAEDAGDIALHVRVPVYELVPETPNLEEVFLNLVGGR
ncbi:ATP-binding cassette domain-containing protein [Actinoplanes sp. TBRC 11911]|uniref:ATP-binding cassette domain-containing protein n=1 Tax=Actinoplanes sp. TBRC 11911 TaxID=2729386 RepID=UPI00145CB73A|nr:ATP-binding cassette domain-containing protein [Actinoplanes sp. TBRC 11911]NMO55113.1 ATP-binding cassette domain-containing protein [Actinoplanes sp. TBRC 11911]